MMKNIAVISAGGTGNRIGGDRPKQLRHLPDGRTVLQTCIDAFRTCRQIDEIIVVMHPDWIDAVPTGVHVVAGGKERWESSWLAIQAIEQAYRTALQDQYGIHATDDAGVVLRYMPSVPITVVMGDSTNRKITFAGDLRHDPTRPLDAG